MLRAWPLLLAACISHEPVPETVPRDARAGLAPAGFDSTEACGHWGAAAHGDGPAASHVSFPERDAARSCFVPVEYDGEIPHAGRPPVGCAYTSRDAQHPLEDEARRYDRIAAGDEAALPLEIACKLSPERRRAVAKVNARTLRSVAGDEGAYPYAAVETFGFGHPSHAGTALDAWQPGDACPAGIDLRRFSVNVSRAGRAALAYAAHVAPVVIVSGGAVHSRLVEAFLLDYIVTCRIGVPPDRVLLDPCADHTHTNVRNGGRLVRALGARTAYIVTDDSFQAVYLQERTAFDLFGGSIDQRALRDWGYLIGSWRQASEGMDAGFWYTPYRFWADPHLAGFACVR